jgi:hypothetical protein
LAAWHQNKKLKKKTKNKTKTKKVVLNEGEGHQTWAKL